MSLDVLFQKLKGGAGSGNFGHSGRPGKVGGSVNSLSSGNFLMGKKVKGGIGENYFVSKDGEDYILKLPQNINSKDLYSEELSYKTSKLLGLNIVPHTEIINTNLVVDKNGERAVYSPKAIIQKKVMGDSPKNFSDLRAKSNRENLRESYILDHVTGNYDRHYKNYVIEASGKLHAIDNGVSFTSMTYERSGNQMKEPWKSLTGQKSLTLNNGEIAKLKSLADNQDYKEEIINRFGEKSYNSLRNRVDEAIAQGKLF